MRLRRDGTRLFLTRRDGQEIEIEGLLSITRSRDEAAKRTRILLEFEVLDDETKGEVTDR